MSDVESLKSVSDRYLGAWSQRDLDTIVEIEQGRGYGYALPFPRPVRGPDELRSGLQSYFDSLDLMRLDLIDRQIEVIGATGLVWGHYSQTTKQKDGPIRTVFLRFTHTYALVDGSWSLVLYHRSLIPNESIP